MRSSGSAYHPLVSGEQLDRARPTQQTHTRFRPSARLSPPTGDRSIHHVDLAVGARVDRRERADLTVHGQVRVSDPRVVDVGLRNHLPQVDPDVEGRRIALDALHEPAAQRVHRHPDTVGAVPEVPGDVVEHHDELRGSGAHRGCRLECVVALVGVKRPVLAAGERLVVRQKRRPAVPVIDEIEVAAKVGVPRKALVVVRQRGGGQMKIVARKKRRARWKLGERLLREHGNGGREDEAHGNRKDRVPR